MTDPLQDAAVDEDEDGRDDDEVEREEDKVDVDAPDFIPGVEGHLLVAGDLQE